MPAMKMPGADPAAIAKFEALRPRRPDVIVKKVFGHPAAFVRGNMFMGVFGEQVFVRLSEPALAELGKHPGVRFFEPMPGRAMRGYAVLPATLLAKPRAAGAWVQKSFEFASSLPPKGTGPKKATKKVA
ncbi:MAG: TfoX/Sxy family protein [Thermoplasmata archaeon]|nr:TfoX/Sxy family protein [Thermoplasmata archaeon]